MEELSDLPWLREPVQLRLLSGHRRVLIDVRREPCRDCGTGVRFTSVWACTRGRGEVVSWCGHCFNAICEAARLDGGQLERFQRVRGSLARGQSCRTWPAVRPALEDLERRGLL